MRTSRWIILLLCSWAYGRAGRTQEANSPSGAPIRVHGVVVNAVTQAPIGRVLVTSADQRMAMMTDDKGRFEFEMRAPGSRTLPLRGVPGSDVAYLVAKKPGYLVVGPPFPLEVTDDGALKSEVRLQLMPEATISGLVAAPVGDPPLGLTVQLLRKQVQDGAAIWTPSTAMEADARGRYRFGGLTPGEYKVVTAEWVDRIGSYSAMAGKPMVGYPPEAFPSGSSPSTAGIIHLAGGQNIEADINLRGATYYSVEIPIVSNSRADSATVAVESEDGSSYSLGFNGRTQRVEGALPDGVYHLTVTENAGLPQSGRRPNFLAGSGELRVAGKPVQGSPIKLLPGVTITVTVSEQYTGPDPTAETEAPTADAPTIAPVTGVAVSQITTPAEATKNEGIQDPEGKVIHPPEVQIFLLAAEGKMNGFGVTGSQQDEPRNEKVVIENVFPGSYRVQVNPRRGYVASATANGINLLREPLVLAPGATSPAIAIVLRDDTATITGSVLGDAAKAGTSPLPHLIWAYPLGDSEAARPASGFQQPDGKFTMSGVVPGRYLVLASKAESLNLEYRNPDAMKAFESKGVIVSVSSGQTANVELKEAVMDDSWSEMETVE